MKELKDGIRSLVRIDFQGHVHKQFRGTGADERFLNEVTVLRTLEERGAPHVPRLLDSDPDSLTIVTTNCGGPALHLTESRARALFRELEQDFGVRHDDPEPRNVTYSQQLGRFCLIDFELATILPAPVALKEEAAPSGVSSPEPQQEDLGWRARWHALSRKGRNHHVNDDSFLIVAANRDEERKLDSRGEAMISPDHLVFAVADGMGGRKAGDFASKLVLNFFRRDLQDLCQVADEGTGIQRALSLLIQTIHEGLLAIAGRDLTLNGCGSTLTVGWVSAGVLHWVHVGDSRLYLKDGGHVEQLTTDDNRLWHTLQKGEITEYAYRHDKRRSVLFDALGGGHHRVRPQTGSIEIEPGARILLCTDGVMDGLWDRQILEAFAEDRSIDDIATEMLNRSCENDPHDDTTLIVAEFEVV